MPPLRTDITDGARCNRSVKKGRPGVQLGQPKYGKKTGVYIDNDKYPIDRAACGTRKNYRAHLRRGQNPCTPCKAAEARDRSDRRDRKLQKGIRSER